MRFFPYNREDALFALVHTDLILIWEDFARTNAIQISREKDLVELGRIPQLFFAYTVLPQEDSTRELLLHFRQENDPTA